MAKQIVSVHAGIYGMGIYAIMLPSSGFSVAHWPFPSQPHSLYHMVFKVDTSTANIFLILDCNTSWYIFFNI